MPFIPIGLAPKTLAPKTLVLKILPPKILVSTKHPVNNGAIVMVLQLTVTKTQPQS